MARGALPGARVGGSGGVEPGFELGCGAEVEESAEVYGIVEGCALVVEHDVVRAGYAHNVVDASGAQHG
jgi:uncharacterized protein YneR